MLPIVQATKPNTLALVILFCPACWKRQVKNERQAAGSGNEKRMWHRLKKHSEDPAAHKPQEKCHQEATSADNLDMCKPTEMNKRNEHQVLR